MCEHLWKVDPDNPPSAPDAAGRRFVHVVCEHCGERISKISTKTDRQLAAELAAQ